MDTRRSSERELLCEPGPIMCRSSRALLLFCETQGSSCIKVNPPTGMLAVWGGRDTPHSLEKAKQFQTIHPVCQVCKSAGVEERTRGKKKMKRIREAEDDN
ncbi:uncharacterized protein LOC144878991 [Branchiostoma floridae x Branchiostoma japonicum]